MSRIGCCGICGWIKRGTCRLAAASNIGRKSEWSMFFSRVRPHSSAPLNPSSRTARSSSLAASRGEGVGRVAKPSKRSGRRVTVAAIRSLVRAARSTLRRGSRLCNAGVVSDSTCISTPLASIKRRRASLRSSSRSSISPRCRPRPPLRSADDDADQAFLTALVRKCSSIATIFMVFLALRYKKEMPSSQPSFLAVKKRTKTTHQPFPHFSSTAPRRCLHRAHIHILLRLWNRWVRCRAPDERHGSPRNIGRRFRRREQRLRPTRKLLLLAGWSSIGRAPCPPPRVADSSVQESFRFGWRPRGEPVRYGLLPDALRLHVLRDPDGVCRRQPQRGCSQFWIFRRQRRARTASDQSWDLRG